MAAPLRFDVYDLLALARENFVEIIRRAMKFLRAENEINVGQLID